MKGYVTISLVDVYERVEKSVISVDERPKRFTDVFYRCEKDWETFWFCDLFRLSGPPVKRTPSIKRTLGRVPEINVLYICIYNEPLLSGRGY